MTTYGTHTQVGGRCEAVSAISAVRCINTVRWHQHLHWQSACTRTHLLPLHATLFHFVLLPHLPADLSGGFQALYDAYSNFVAVNLRDVLTLHILLFVLTVVLMIGYVFFMVLPFVKATTYETRRIAELISQLPAEVGGCPPHGSGWDSLAVQETGVHTQSTFMPAAPVW